MRISIAAACCAEAVSQTRARVSFVDSLLEAASNVTNKGPFWKGDGAAVASDWRGNDALSGGGEAQVPGGEPSTRAAFMRWGRRGGGRGGGATARGGQLTVYDRVRGGQRVRLSTRTEPRVKPLLLRCTVQLRVRTLASRISETRASFSVAMWPGVCAAHAPSHLSSCCFACSCRLTRNASDYNDRCG